MDGCCRFFKKLCDSEIIWSPAQQNQQRSSGSVASDRRSVARRAGFVVPQPPLQCTPPASRPLIAGSCSRPRKRIVRGCSTAGPGSEGGWQLGREHTRDRATRVGSPTGTCVRQAVSNGPPMGCHGSCTRRAVGRCRVPACHGLNPSRPGSPVLIADSDRITGQRWRRRQRRATRRTSTYWSCPGRWLCCRRQWRRRGRPGSVWRETSRTCITAPWRQSSRRGEPSLNL